MYSSPLGNGHELQVAEQHPSCRVSALFCSDISRADVLLRLGLVGDAQRPGGERVLVTT